MVCPPLGLSHARNEGFRRAAGPVVAFLDDDETVDEGYVAGLLRAAEAGAAAVVGPVLSRGSGVPHSHYDGDKPMRFRGMRTPPWRIGTGGNMAFTRATFEDVRGFDIRLGAGSAGAAGEDFDIIVRLLRAGVDVHWEPRAIAYHPTKSEAQSLASRYPYGYGVGRMAAQLRSPFLALRYGVALTQATRDGVRARDRTRLRSTAATAHGFAAGLAGARAGMPVTAALETLPDAMRAAVGGAAVRALPLSPRRVAHRRFGVGHDALLHLYAEEAARSALPDALEARRAVAGLGVRGVPAVRAVAETAGAVWLLEDRLPGRRADERRPPGWWAHATAWFTGLVTRDGPPVRATAWWERSRPELLAVAPHAAAPVAAALERLGDLPAVPLHGEPHLRHLLFTPGEVSVVVWEAAVATGPPGVDLVLLALAAGDGRDTVRALLRGQEPPAGPLLDSLDRAGLAGAVVRAAVLAALAHAAALERRRLELLGLPRPPARAAALLRDATAAHR